MTRRARHRLYSCAAAAIGLAVLAPTRTVSAADATIPVRNGDYIYDVDVAARMVHVHASIRVANEGSIGVRTCFTNFQLPVPVGSVGHRALDRSVVLDLEVMPAATDATQQTLQVELQECLDYGRQDLIEVSYDLPGGEPRSAAPARVSAEYAAFVAWGAGRAGGSSIEIILPATHRASSLGDDWTVADAFGKRVYTKSAIRDPNTYRVLFAARASSDDSTDDSTNDGASDNGVEEITAGGHPFELIPSPGDGEWVDHVSQRLGDDLAALEQAIGAPWPVAKTYTVREAYTPIGSSAANWPTDPTGTEVGEQLDRTGVLDGLAVAWFGSDRFTDQWLAQSLTRVHAAIAGGNPEFAPESLDAAVATIVDEIGPAGMAEILTRIADGVTAYDTSARAAAGPSPIDWRAFLDHVEEVGGATNAADLLAPFVPEADLEWLALRDASRAAYVALSERGTPWQTPLGVRDAMSRWAFAEADELMTAADDALDRRDSLSEALADSPLDLPDDLRAAYEAATDDLADVAQLIAERTSVAPVMVGAVQSDNDAKGLIAAVGLIGSDADERLAAARRAFDNGEIVVARDEAFAAIRATSSASFEGAKRLMLTWGISLATLVAVLGVRDIARFIRRRNDQQEAP